MASRLGGAAASTPAAAPRPTAAAPTVVKSIVSNGRSATPLSAGKIDENIAPASADLLKWCKEALKGLDIPGEQFSQLCIQRLR
jgi:hypothetical protein